MDIYLDSTDITAEGFEEEWSVEKAEQFKARLIRDEIKAEDFGTMEAFIQKQSL